MMSEIDDELLTQLATGGGGAEEAKTADDKPSIRGTGKKKKMAQGMRSNLPPLPAEKKSILIDERVI